MWAGVAGLGLPKCVTSHLARSTPACFNCESGLLLPGTYGRYCAACDTYLPTGQAAREADGYFAALDNNEVIRAGEIKICLEYFRQKTIESIRDAGNH